MNIESLEQRTLFADSTDPVGVEYVASPSPHLLITPVPTLGSGAGYDIYTRPLSTSGTPGSWTKLNSTTLAESTTTYGISSPTSTVAEYRVDHKYSFGTVANSSYIAVGEAAEPVHSRGVILLAVDETVADDLSLNDYKQDLAGDGWTVEVAQVPRADVPRYVPTSTEIAAGFSSSPQYVAWRAAVATTKDTIRDAYDNSDEPLKAVVLIGHVAVPYAGTNSADGHNSAPVGLHGGATTSDMFYGDMGSDSDWSDSVTRAGMMYAQNNNYPNDGKFDNDFLPAGHQLDVGIGRIDFSLLSAYGVPLASTSPPTPEASASSEEIDLLQNYFARNHDWRAGAVQVDRQAAYNSSLRGTLYDGPTEYRLAANVGSSNLHLETWVDEMSSPAGTQDDGWLWGIASGGGGYAGINIYTPTDADSIATRDLNDTHNVFLSAHDFADNANTSNANQTVLNQMFGSFVGDWDKQNSLLMGSIAQSGGLGLATMYAGRPQTAVHTMAAGETFADAETRTMTASSGYNIFYLGTEMSLLGDPAIRESYVLPATNLNVELEEQSQSTSRAATLAWDESADSSVAGYYVYWSANKYGSYELLDDNDSDSNGMVEGSGYVDTDPDHQAGFYMVRAAKLEETPSGSYWNLGTGVIAAPVAHYATFQWDDSPQRIVVAMTNGVPLDDTNSDVAVTIAGERYDHATSAFVSTSFTAGTDFSLDALPPFDPLPAGAAIGWVLQINILTTSDAGIAHVLPSGHYTVTVTYGGHSFVKQIIFASGDTNGDGAVDFNDLVVVAQHYGDPVDSEHSFGLGDFDNDGDVDFDDLVILAQNYGLSMA